MKQFICKNSIYCTAHSGGSKWVRIFQSVWAIQVRIAQTGGSLRVCILPSLWAIRACIGWSGFEWQVASLKYQATSVSQDLCRFIQHNLCPGSAFCSLIYREHIVIICLMKIEVFFMFDLEVRIKNISDTKIKLNFLAERGRNFRWIKYVVNLTKIKKVYRKHSAASRNLTRTGLRISIETLQQLWSV